MLKNSIHAILSLLFLFAWTHSLPSEELIDVVYTWVDGSDPLWQASLNEYAKKDNASTLAIAKKRFKNRDELLYSLRSIYAFAPWVNHIYIVTCGQTPEWLMPHPKITIVSHDEIFKNPNDLPTFNSMAIECNLHRIQGLQEHYLYFNDDVFLGAPTTPDTFFTKDGKMKLFFSDRKLSTGIPVQGDEGFIAASKNTSALLDARYGVKRRHTHAHTPYPTIKSLVFSVEALFPAVFASVSTHRFRSLVDYTVTNGLIPYVAFYTGQGKKESVAQDTISFGKDLVNDRKLLTSLLQSSPKFFCIQDASNDDNTESIALLHEFFESYFPAPAPWEKTETDTALILENDAKNYSPTPQVRLQSAPLPHQE